MPAARAVSAAVPLPVGDGNVNSHEKVSLVPGPGGGGGVGTRGQDRRAEVPGTKESRLVPELQGSLPSHETPLEFRGKPEHGGLSSKTSKT